MKRKTDPRHLRRITLIQELFSWSFQKKSKPSPQINQIITHLSRIDEFISQSAPDRPINQINRVDLSILRLAVYELMVEKKEPPKVIIDEAIELGKEFGSDSSASFINGALGKLMEGKNI